MENPIKRVVVHIDLDAFYAQVEMRLLGSPDSVPLAVQQWDGLIAVNYPARAAGISRHCRVAEAKRLCPDIVLVHVETLDKDGKATVGKAAQATDKVSLQRYRVASMKIFRLLLRLVGEKHVEKASVDEAYLDVSTLVDDLLSTGAAGEGSWVSVPAAGSTSEDGTTAGAGSKRPRPADHCVWSTSAVHAVSCRSDTHVVGPSGTEVAGIWRDAQTSGEGDTIHSSHARIAAGALIAAAIRERIRAELGYTCSAGISHCKMLAKLGSGRNKPAQQTCIPSTAVQALMVGLPLRKIRFLGGKLGVHLAMETIAAGHVPPVDATSSSTGSTAVVEEGEEGGSDREDENSDGELDDTRQTPFRSALAATHASSSGSQRLSPKDPRVAAVTAGQAQQLSLSHLRNVFAEEKTAAWLYGIVRGVDDSSVQARVKPQQLMAAKSISPGSCLTVGQACGWIRMLAAELVDRVNLDEEVWQRSAKRLTLSYALEGVHRVGEWGAGKSKAGSMPGGRPKTVDAVHAAACALVRKAAEEEYGSLHSPHPDSTPFRAWRFALAAGSFESMEGMRDIGKFMAATGAGGRTVWDTSTSGQAQGSASGGQSSGASSTTRGPAVKGIGAYFAGKPAPAAPPALEHGLREEEDGDLVCLDSSQEDVGAVCPPSGHICPICTRAIVVPQGGLPSKVHAAINAHVDACLKGRKGLG